MTGEGIAAVSVIFNLTVTAFEFITARVSTTLSDNQCTKEVVLNCPVAQRHQTSHNDYLIRPLTTK